VAERLGLAVATLRAWRHRGTGPRFLRFGRAVRYLPADLDEFIRASAVDTRAVLLMWDTAWRALRAAAGLPGFRFHDLRHTIITELAEMGVADHVLESITGHLTRRILEHYSHIRIDAKRQSAPID
jgi:integrase